MTNPTDAKRKEAIEWVDKRIKITDKWLDKHYDEEGFDAHPRTRARRREFRHLRTLRTVLEQRQTKTVTKDDVKFLEWIFARLHHIHGERKDYDYMLRFKGIIEKIKKIEVEGPPPGEEGEIDRRRKKMIKGRKA